MQYSSHKTFILQYLNNMKDFTEAHLIDEKIVFTSLEVCVSDFIMIETGHKQIMVKLIDDFETDIKVDWLNYPELARYVYQNNFQLDANETIFPLMLN